MTITKDELEPSGVEQVKLGRALLRFEPARISSMPDYLDAALDALERAWAEIAGLKTKVGELEARYQPRGETEDATADELKKLTREP